MTISFDKRRWAILTATLTLVAFALPATTLGANTYSLDVLWSTPITGPPPPPPAGQLFYRGLGAGLILKSQAIFPNGRVAFLGEQIPPRIDQNSPAIKIPVLVTDAEHQKGEDAVILQVAGRDCLRGMMTFFETSADRIIFRMPYIKTLAIGSDGDILVGGDCNQHLDMVSAPQSDGYVARLDVAGRLLWERTYRSRTGYRDIQSVATTPSGDLAVSGADYNDGWVGRLAPGGAERWTMQLGNNLGNAVATLPDDRIVVGGFDGTEVYTWIMDKAGAVVAATRTRNSIGEKYARVGKIAVAATTDAIYVVSYWNDMFHPQPVAVAKLQVDGKLAWSTVLSDTIFPLHTAAPTWQLCAPAVAIMPNQDAVIACALENQIQLYRLDASSGAEQESRIPLPDCQAGHPAALFLAIRDDRTALLSGSRPSSNVAANCTWVGRLMISQ
jgi:hypothetical protein